MQLISKNGQPYYVCSKTAIDEAPTPADPPVQEFSSISLMPPVPTIRCSTCSFAHTVDLSHIKCTLCASSTFSWSCPCTVPKHESKTSVGVPPLPLPASLPPTSVLPQTQTPSRPRRSQSQKSWVEKIKYESPVRRGIPYHTLSCVVDPKATTVATVEFANVYKMVPALCCHATGLVF